MEFFDSGPVGDRQILFVISPGTVHKLLGAVGAKVSVGGAWLVTGTVLFSLNDNGIKPAVTPVIGFERAFRRQDGSPFGEHLSRSQRFPARHRPVSFRHNHGTNPLWAVVRPPQL